MSDLRRLGGCKPKSALDRFHASYKKSVTGCWLWRGAPRGSNGYGRIKVGGASMPAHRFSWIIHFGEIVGGLLVLHRCDTPLCVNPAHIFLGTHQDNMDDCRSKGRTNGGTKTPMRGSQNARSKLSAEQVIAIRQDDRSQREIAAQYGVSQALVSKIKRNEMWRHI